MYMYLGYTLWIRISRQSWSVILCPPAEEGAFVGPAGYKLGLYMAGHTGGYIIDSNF